MNSRRRNFSDDPQTIRRRSSQLSEIDEFLLKIPIDLIIEIFSRLSLKSIARCRCVSKRWASVLGRSDFTELFFTKSLARPQLLFACQTQSEFLFFSSPQPQIIDGNLSLIATVDHHMAFPFENVCYISNPINGFVCIRDDRMLKGRKTGEVAYVICNPSTRQSFTLPKMKTKKMTQMRSYLGYDPIDKQHKVLAIIRQQGGVVKHQVLTLKGTGNLTWRITKCGISHSFPGPDYICISGVLYYFARASSGDDMIGCFDVRSEKYTAVKVVEKAVCYSTLVNYNGKLASLMAQMEFFDTSGIISSFEMWILEDPEKHEWSKRILKLPSMWKDVAAWNHLTFRGLTATNEIVLSSPNPSSGSFHAYYYNFDKETITRVEIQGMEAFERCYEVFTLNHVENVILV